MPLDVDPKVVTLFGNAARVRTLAALAGSDRPLTGYRVAQMTGENPSKTYTELRRLVGDIVESVPVGRGLGWVLRDPDIRSLMRRRVRIGTFGLLEKERRSSPSRTEKSVRRLAGSVNLSQYRGWNPPAAALEVLKEFERPTEKDRTLRKMGLRVSYREGVSIRHRDPTAK